MHVVRYTSRKPLHRHAGTGRRLHPIRFDAPGSGCSDSEPIIPETPRRRSSTGRRPQTHTIHGAHTDTSRRGRALLFATYDLHDCPCSCANSSYRAPGNQTRRQVSGYDDAIFPVLGRGANLLVTSTRTISYCITVLPSVVDPRFGCAGLDAFFFLNHVDLAMQLPVSFQRFRRVPINPTKP
jgi:hypothetical protein